jgi:hypothetical protein
VTLEEFLAQVPGHRDFSRKSLILLFAYYLRRHAGSTSFGMQDVRECFAQAALRVPTDLGALLKSLSNGRRAPLLRVTGGDYALSAFGAAEVEAVLPAAPVGTAQLGSFLDVALPHLRRVIGKVTDPQRRDFLAEAIACLGAGARRATVILTWIAALDHMQDYVITHHLVAFNSALAKRTDKLAKLQISSRDDFSEISEASLIEVCRSAAIITKDVRKILDEKLGFRNSCAHPSSIQIGDSKVVSFIEDLVDNVIAKYPI